MPLGNVARSMNIAICSTIVPFIDGGARFIVKWLASTMRSQGHKVEEILLPFSDDPDVLIEQIVGLRLLDVAGSADRLIALRPPSYVLPHGNKVLWFIHHIRVFYDLWKTPPYGPPDNAEMRSVRRALMTLDKISLQESRSVFTNSQVVGRRLLEYNGVESSTLYPPLFEAHRFGFRDLGNEIVYICRVEHHKRQHLAVEAMKHVKSAVKLRICGASWGWEYLDSMRNLVREFNMESRVTLQFEWISEEEKISLLSHCLAALYIPLDEDSYGYPSLEASHSQKAIITTSDSGGVLELVEDGDNGFVSDPTPEALALCFDRLFEDRKLARELGRRAEAKLRELNINWDHVVEKLLS